MKKILMAAAFLAVGSTGAMAQTVNLSLSGYCDTFSLVEDGFAIYGTHAGCGSTYVEGGATVKIGGKLLQANETADGKEIFTWYFTEPKHNRGSWYVYEETQSGVSELNSGTYTLIGAGAVAHTGKSAIARR
jgi:hypothetical protein